MCLLQALQKPTSVVWGLNRLNNLSADFYMHQKTALCRFWSHVPSFESPSGRKLLQLVFHQTVSDSSSSKMAMSDHTFRSGFAKIIQELIKVRDRSAAS